MLDKVSLCEVKIYVYSRQIGVNERCDALMHVMLGGTLVVPIFAKILQWTRKIAST